MKAIKQVWDDIRSGENLEFYLLFAAIIGIFILQLTSVNIGLIIPLVTLGALGILANSALQNRRRVEELSQKIVPSLNSAFLEEFPSTLKNDFESSSTLWLVGVSLNRTIRDNLFILERKLQRGDTIKILLVHPNGAASEIASSRPYPPVPAESTQNYICDSLRYLCDLKRSTSGSLEVRTIQNPLTYGVIASNPNTPNGVLYCELYPFQTAGNTLPKFMLRAKESQWYEFFKNELESLWKNGVDWQCASES